MRRLAIVLSLTVAPAAARTSLGVFERWGAFRDETQFACFAIAEPVRRGGGTWRSFASVASWPRSQVRGQLHIRLTRPRAAEQPATLHIGPQRFALTGSGVDLWAPDPGTDAAIIAAMRSAPSMRVEARGAAGGAFSETYALKGAATALDAAALGCARR